MRRLSRSNRTSQRLITIVAGRYATCQFSGIRTRDESYVEHTRVVDPSTGDCISTDQRERYDLSSDPFELHNLCFGGEKRNRLFMAASQSIYAVYVETQGAHVT